MGCITYRKWMNASAWLALSQGLNGTKAKSHKHKEKVFFKKKNLLLSNTGLQIRKKFVTFCIRTSICITKETCTIGKTGSRRKNHLKFDIIGACQKHIMLRK